MSNQAFSTFLLDISKKNFLKSVKDSNATCTNPAMYLLVQAAGILGE